MRPDRASNVRARGALARLALLSAVAASSPAVCRAAAIRYEYGGTVTSADPSTGVAPGTRFSGEFTYDPNPSLNNPAIFSTITPSPTDSGLQFGVGAKTVYDKQMGVDISVQQTPPFALSQPPLPGTTEVTVSNLDPLNAGGTKVQMTFDNPTRQVYPDAKNFLPLSLSDYTKAGLLVTDTDASGATKTLYSGTVDTLKEVPIPLSLDGVPLAVPEPASVAAWLGFSLAALGWTARRVKRTPSA